MTVINRHTYIGRIAFPYIASRVVEAAIGGQYVLVFSRNALSIRPKVKPLEM